ncbi:hypothetical protein GGI07_003732 [Coemansia sp. Benny D115]|nr:hypothetical protein GGI07_003732 [Coemansia sp. Benny D115]
MDWSHLFMPGDSSAATGPGSFDAEGFDLGPYLASPQPMANFSSRPDYSSIGIGMGIGAGMMGGMDDSIPHLSLDESQHDSAAAAAAVAAAAAAAHGLTRMTTGTSTLTPNQSHFNSNTDNNNNNTNSGMAPMRRQSFFEYGLGGTSHLSLGNVMNEEMHKVSSWLIQNQDHHSISPITPQQHTFASIPTTALPAAHRSSSERQFMHPHTTRVTSPLTQQQMQYNRPPSESDMSIKRKASQEQLELPRKSRGPVWSPMRESPMSPTDAATQSNSMSQAAASAAEMMAADPKMAGTMFSIKEEPEKTSVDPSTPDNTEGGKRREEKKNTQRVVLTEEERRANHIASEQRRRNQIRQGYAELMSLVTTLRDPALGNHPGTAQSTPSKAVILSHAVQFIRGLEEGNRLLRKRIEGTPRHLAQPMGQRPFQVPTPMHRKQQPHTANMGAGGGPESTS